MHKRIQEVVNNIDFKSLHNHPNILIAARFWDDDRYNAARICYKFMRRIDDMIDNRKASGTVISNDEKDVLTREVNSWIDSLNRLKTKPSIDQSKEEIVSIIKNFKVPLLPFQNFARSMIYDINNNGFQTFEDFLSYSEGASVAPASVFVHLCCLSRENGEYLVPSFDIIDVARPCAIFSYIVHIIRDFQKDQHNNLNYFALDILEKNELTPTDLKRIADGAPVPGSFRNVIGEYRSKAEYYNYKTLEELEKLETKVAPNYFFSLKIIHDLYLQVFERIDVDNGNFSTKELNPSPIELKQRVLNIITDK